jgi:hypothetical protein
MIIIILLLPLGHISFRCLRQRKTEGAAQPDEGMGNEVMRGSSGVAVLHNGRVGQLLAGGSAMQIT